MGVRWLVSFFTVVVIPGPSVHYLTVPEHNITCTVVHCMFLVSIRTKRQHLRKPLTDACPRSDHRLPDPITTRTIYEPVYIASCRRDGGGD